LFCGQVGRKELGGLASILRLKSNPIVAEMIVEVFEFETWNKLIEQSRAFVDLGFKEIRVATGF
jgi:hypothetical protein